jgi:hypothetical protein
MLKQSPNRRVAEAVLVSAAAVERAGVEALPRELEALREALRAAGDTLAASASQVVPAPEPAEHSLCGRFQRAAAGWPTSPAPPYEAFAGTLARLHQAADETRLAARRCDDARVAVEALLRTSS